MCNADAEPNVMTEPTPLSRSVRIRCTVARQPWALLFIVAVMLLALWRLKLALVKLAALLGWSRVSAAVWSPR
jgi:hypothetical protein